MLWVPAKDSLVLLILINLSRRDKGPRATFAMTRDEGLLNFLNNLTCRMILKVATVYDPLEFLTQITLKAKLMIRCMIRKEAEGSNKLTGWDEPLAETCVNDWHDFFLSLNYIEMSFPRCIKYTSINIVGEPMLMFSDGSNLVFWCCGCIKWQLSSGGYNVHFLASRNRIALVEPKTIPIMELCGAVFSCKLREYIESKLNLKYSEVMHAVHSTIVLLQVQKESQWFNKSVASRMAETECKSNLFKW